MKMTNLFEKDLKRIANQAFNRQLDGKDLAILAKYLLEKKITDLHYDMVEELPNFIPPRKVLLFESTLYRGAKENEFMGVDVGTPVIIATSTAP